MALEFMQTPSTREWTKKEKVEGNVERSLQSRSACAGKSTPQSDSGEIALRKAGPTSAGRHFQSGAADSEVKEAGALVGGMALEFAAGFGCGLRIGTDDVEEAATTGASEFGA